MKCLSLTQPYASLIALGQKNIETRSWSTSFRGPLAIHAAAGLRPVGGQRGLHELIDQEPFWSVLREAFTVDLGGEPFYPGDAVTIVDQLPRGAIVAVCELKDCLPIKMYSIGDSAENGTSYPLPPDPEQSFGDYSVGRYAWLLADVRALPEPIPCRGKLGLWDYEGELPL